MSDMWCRSIIEFCWSWFLLLPDPDPDGPAPLDVDGPACCCVTTAIAISVLAPEVDAFSSFDFFFRFFFAFGLLVCGLGELVATAAAVGGCPALRGPELDGPTLARSWSVLELAGVTGEGVPELCNPNGMGVNLGIWDRIWGMARGFPTVAAAAAAATAAGEGEKGAGGKGLGNGDWRAGLGMGCPVWGWRM